MCDPKRLLSVAPPAGQPFRNIPLPPQRRGTPISPRPSSRRCLAPLLAAPLFLLAAACGGGSNATPPPRVSYSATTPLAPTAGGPDTEVVLTGQGFTGATEVYFTQGAPMAPSGVVLDVPAASTGAPSPKFSILSDTEIIAEVPPNAATGPVAVASAPDGLVATPEPFTFTGPALPAASSGSGSSGSGGTGSGASPTPAPEPAPITNPSAVDGFAPTAGSPGMPVVFQGQGLDQAANIQVSFNGTRASAEWASPDGSQMVAWVPDGATTGDVRITVNGAVLNTGTFTVLPSRLDLLSGQMVQVPDLYGRAMFDYPEIMRTEQYGSALLPQAPVVHPYDMAANDRHAGALAIALNLKLPSAFREALPDSIKKTVTALESTGLDLSKLDVYLVSQNQPWNNAAPYEFRPHYWLDPGVPAGVSPSAPNGGEVDDDFPVFVGLFEAEPGVTMERDNGAQAPANAVFFSLLQVQTIDYVTLSEPDSLQIAGLDYNQSTSFWSLVVDGDRAAATLHWVLNDDAQNELTAILTDPDLGGKAPTFTDLVAGINRSFHLDETSLADQALALFRPIVTFAALSGEDPDTHAATLTLIGTGLSGAETVTAGNDNETGLAPPIPFSDSLVQVPISADAARAGNIILTTTFGSSEPIALLAQ